jgi:hypothetical protein
LKPAVIGTVIIATATFTASATAGVVRRHQAVTGTRHLRVPAGIARVRVMIGAMAAGMTGAVMNGAIRVRVARMMVAGNVVTATGTKVTEIRTGHVATTTAVVGKMKTAIEIVIETAIETAIVIARRISMMVSVASWKASHARLHQPRMLLCRGA